MHYSSIRKASMSSYAFLKFFIKQRYSDLPELIAFADNKLDSDWFCSLKWRKC